MTRLRYVLVDGRRFVTCLILDHRAVGVYPAFCKVSGADLPAKRWPR